MSFDEGTVLVRVTVDQGQHFIETGNVVLAERKVLHILCEKTIIKGEQFLFRVLVNGEEHFAVLCDFEEGETLCELDNHVFKVTALHKLGPEGDVEGTLRECAGR